MGEGLPPCPLCQAPARDGVYRSPFDLAHDCDCLATAPEAYTRALLRLWHERLCLERFLAGLPRRYREFTFEGYTPHRGVEQALAAAAGLGVSEWLYLWGPPGRGKTHLAVAAARRLASQGHRTLFLSEAAYLEALYHSFRGGGEPPDYREAEALVLDDLGKIKPTEFAYQTLYALFEHFYSEGKTLIVTSNYAPVQAAQRLAMGEPEAASALASRLGQGQVFALGGQDRRAA